jgi:hypothetical protein
MKYTGTKVSGNEHRLHFVDAFAHVFLRGCRLTHFEVSFGSEAYCSGERHDEDPLYEVKQEKILRASFAYLSAQRRMLVALCQNAHASLKVFIDQTCLSWAFMATIVFSKGAMIYHLPRPRTAGTGFQV